MACFHGFQDCIYMYIYCIHTYIYILYIFCTYIVHCAYIYVFMLIIYIYVYIYTYDKYNFLSQFKKQLILSVFKLSFY